MADLTALAYCRPAEFLDRHAGRRYTQRRPASIYYGRTAADGVVRGVDQAVVDEIRALDSVCDLTLKLVAGDRIQPTVDLRTATMKAFLVGESEEAVDRDWRRLDELHDRVYQVA